MPIPIFVAEDLARLGVDLPAETLSALADYLDMLLDENTRQNLTAVRDRDAAWRRHIIDSLTLWPGLNQLPSNAKVIDVGSGGGLPGMVLGISKPSFEVTLLESSGKKAKFLERCASGLGLTNITVECARAETAGHLRKHRQAYDAAVCRAIGPLSESLEYTLPFVGLGGWLFAIKGPSVLDELDGAGDALMTLGAGEVEVYEAYPEAFDHGSKIIVIVKERPTPRAYPRPPGVPRKTPL